VKRLICGLVLLLVAAGAFAAAPVVRLKDIAQVLEARDNQLMGFGLVVGLRNTGDKTQTGFTQQALTNLLSRMGVVPQSVDFKSKNTAAVMVTATLPPFVKPGQKIDITVASVGDATSLQGGTLLITPLQGVDDQVYAVAQGNLLIGLEPSQPNVPYVRQPQSTTGRIPSGAIVEKEVPVSLDGKGQITIVLNQPDFTTANRVADAIIQAGFEAGAKDAGTIIVSLGDQDLVATIAKVENVRVTADSVAKVIINEKTGTVVFGENVKLAPCAVSYGGIDVLIGNMNLFSEGTASDNTLDESRYRATTNANIARKANKLKVLPASPTLSQLVKALNALGASPKDLMAILQALKNAGALKAELEVQ